VTTDYLATMGMSVRRGRGFTLDDESNTQPVAIVSESMARALWPNADPIGKRIGYPYQSPWITVVGVVPDVKSDSLRDTTAQAVYIPFTQRQRDQIGRARADFTLVLRTSGDPLALAGEVRSIVANIDRSVPVSAVQTMNDVVDRSVSKSRFTTLLVSAFAVVALLLGAVGIYGVMSYVVSQRAQELALRTALGATANDILVMVIVRSGILAGLGAAAGMAAALIAERPLHAMLYGVSPSDPVTYLTVPLVFAAVALIASAGPARKAARVSPIAALRGE